MDTANPKAKPKPKWKPKRPPNRTVQWLIYIVMRASICLVQALRIETCQSIARLMSRLCYDVLRIRRGVVDENLEAAYPELTVQQRAELAREMPSCGMRC